VLNQPSGISTRNWENRAKLQSEELISHLIQVVYNQMRSIVFKSADVLSSVTRLRMVLRRKLTLRKQKIIIKFYGVSHPYPIFSVVLKQNKRIEITVEL
jgi:hypothetical protein